MYFAEGTDLSKGNLKRSHAYAEKFVVKKRGEGEREKKGRRKGEGKKRRDFIWLFI